MNLTGLPTDDRATAGCQAVQRGVLSRWLGANPRYWACLALLVASAAGLNSVAGWLGLRFRKEAVPLKRSLRALDTHKFEPRYVLDKRRTDRLAPLSDDEVDALGTEEYLQVYLTDTQKPEGDPTRTIQLFVTYYTGQPDFVPHVPDECYLAAGYDLVGESTARVPVAGIWAPGGEIPVRVSEFKARKAGAIPGQQRDVTNVVWFFHVNGTYATSRSGVRAVMASPFQRYSYYAKIELTFRSEDGGNAGKEASLAAVGPFLERLMPVLLSDHIDTDKFPRAGGGT